MGVLGDVCRALHKEIMPYCDEIMRCLLELLQSSTINRSVKPCVISIFADLALSIEGEITSSFLCIPSSSLPFPPSSPVSTSLPFPFLLRSPLLTCPSFLLHSLGDFNRYTSIVLGILQQAGEVNIGADADEDMVEYINSLRVAILEAYTGIIQGLLEAKQQDLVLPGM